MAGCVVLITADRRADQLTSLFQRNGASVRRAPVLTNLPNVDDPALIAGTRALVADPPDIVVANTGIGLRGWIEAADAAGLGVALTTALRRTRIVARGAKARGAVQAAGLDTAWVAQSETTAEIIERLLAEGVAGRRVAVQHHGTGSDGLDEALRDAGADVVSLVVYQLGPAPDPCAVAASVRSAAAGEVDVVCFTSAPAVAAWLAAARAQGVHDEVVAALRAGRLVANCVGPVAAAPLRVLGVEPVVPDRSRLGAMVRALVDHYDAAGPGLPTAAGPLQLRSGAVVLAGRVVPLTPSGLAVLRLLADRPGAVVSRAEVLAALPGASTDEHTAEVAVSRLREALGPGVVRTVVKRGYRLETVEAVPAAG
jgi:uroporphyrinogen-III synthase